jgi:ABC-type polysaccharide/polyol phosphate transport system ATPase subunit
MAWVRAEGVWKRFLLQKDRADSVGQLLVRMIPGRSRRPTAEPFWALQDVSLEMPPGTSVGIIGSNGSGKSTMLKLLTRTMLPTRGTIAVHGRVSALIELGAGFHPDFTGRENIVLNASILGIRRREIERRMDDIIEFSEIRSFIDTPVKYYSSGMQARLGFAVAIHVDAEILVVDEVLAVGDESFQQKCMQRILELKRSGIGILLVSHDLGSIERLMDQVVWIERGIVRASGRPGEVVHAYRSRQRDREGSRASQVSVGETADSEGPLEAAGFLVVGGRPADGCNSGDAVEVIVELDNRTATPMTGYLSMTIRRPDGLSIAEISGVDDQIMVTAPPGKTRVVVALRELRLAAGGYEVDCSFETEEGKHIASWSPLLHMKIRAPLKSEGVIVVPHTWRLDGGAAVVTPVGWTQSAPRDS